MGYIGRLDPSSDANSTSFYSNNTSVAPSKNLNNSRYMMVNRRETKVQGSPVVGKVMP